MPRFINPKHLMGATKNSLSGLVFAWKGEQAFRHEVLVLVVLAALLAVTGKDAGQWLLVLGGWLGVMVVELLNSADEESFESRDHRMERTRQTRQGYGLRRHLPSNGHQRGHLGLRFPPELNIPLKNHKNYHRIVNGKTGNDTRASPTPLRKS